MSENELEKILDRKTLNKVRVILVDDHPLMRQALRNTLEKQDDFEVIGEAGNGEEAVNIVMKLKPDIVVMDISMPKLGGLEATRQIKAVYPSIMILILTVHDDTEHILRILNTGANGYLLKSAYEDEVISSIRALISGETVLSRDVSQTILKYASQHIAEPVKLDDGDKLTTRDLTILKLSAKGISNKGIAESLGLSLRTVKGYLADIFLKLNVGSRTEAVIVCLRKGIINLSDLE